MAHAQAFMPFMAAENVTFAPNDPDDWDGNIGDAKAALDELADRTTTVESGYVTGPASSTDNAIARYDGTTGKVIQGSQVTISDVGVFQNVRTIAGESGQALSVTAASGQHAQFGTVSGSAETTIQGGPTGRIVFDIFGIITPSINATTFDFQGLNAANVGDVECDSLTKDGSGDIAVKDNLDLQSTNGILNLALQSGALTKLLGLTSGNDVGGAEIIFKCKAADEARNTTTTLADDNTMDVTLTGSTRYLLLACIFIVADSTTPDVAFAWDGTATMNDLALGKVTFLTSTVQHHFHGSLGDLGNWDQVTTSPQTHLWIGTVDVDSGGTFAYQWAQRTSSGDNTTVKRGSWLLMIALSNT